MKNRLKQSRKLFDSSEELSSDFFSSTCYVAVILRWTSSVIVPGAAEVFVKVKINSIK